MSKRHESAAQVASDAVLRDWERHVVIPAGGYEKHYLTLDLSTAGSAADALSQYRASLSLLIEGEVEIVCERVFGDLSLRRSLDEVRAEVWQQARSTAPQLTYLEGAPNQEAISGALIYGVRAIRRGALRIDRQGARSDGVQTTVLAAGGVRELCLSCATDATAFGAEPAVRFAAAFESVAAALRENDFRPTDIVRTWIFLSDIERDYVAFNRSRREFFAASGIDFGAGESLVPASTGIEGRSHRQSAVTLDVSCIDRSATGCRSTRVHNALQPEAEGDAYPLRPTFARAILTEWDTHRELQISGTASIDPSGQTAFPGAPAEQIRTTLKNVQGLLSGQGFSVEDIAHATYYFKDRATVAAFEQNRRAMGFGTLLGARVMTNICRPDLLFELDGVAVAPRVRKVVR